MDDLHVFSIPLRTRFRGITVREGVLLRGDAGWGEWSPFLEYDDATARPWLACAREAADVGWPEPLRTVVPVNVTVPATDPDRAHAIVTAGGCRTAKVKVAERGQTLADDLARVEAVRDALGPDGLVRVDANGAWDVDEAVRAIAAIDRAAGGLEYVEQPVMAVEDLAVVRRRVDVPVAADESIRRAEDPYRVRDLEAADVAVLKVQPLGGVRACLRIAEDIGLPVVVSSAVESSVGIAAGVALAAALPELHHACGLATVQLLTDDVVTEPMLPVDGMLRVSPTRGGRRGAGAARGSRGPGRPLARPAGVGRAGSASVTNPSTELARTVVTALRGAGVREAVIAPGSRNAPLSFALYDAATGGGLRLHTRIDERTAGFLALGLAKVGNRPAAVSCTSGTAVANLLPAVVEAAHAGVPMVVVTADRPARLRGSGANQTTDQVGIFGSFAPTLDVAAADLDAILAFVRSHGGNRPVHLNVQLDEPLLPDDGGWEAAAEEPPPWPATPAAPVERLVLEPGPRTVVVAGDDAGPPARVLAEKAGWPLLAEPSSGCRTGDSVVRTYRLLLAGELGQQVERVVVHGHPTLSRPVARLLARDDVEVVSARHRGRWAERPFAVAREVDQVDVTGSGRPGVARGLARGGPRHVARARPVPRRRARPHAVRGGRGGQSCPAGRRAAVRRRLQPGPRPRPDGRPLRGRRPPQGHRQPRPGRHRRHHQLGDRRGAGPAAVHARAGPDG